MGFSPSGLRDAFEGQGEAGFIAYSHACHDRLEDALTPGYFSGCTRFRAGDLIWLGINPRPVSCPWKRHQLAAETRRALLKVAGRDAEGLMRVRLVQDFGRPEDPDAEQHEARRPRGRPKTHRE